jgi:hypothetical protein
MSRHPQTTNGAFPSSFVRVSQVSMRATPFTQRVQFCASSKSSSPQHERSSLLVCESFRNESVSVRTKVCHFEEGSFDSVLKGTFVVWMPW